MGVTAEFVSLKLADCSTNTAIYITSYYNQFADTLTPISKMFPDIG